MNERMPDFRMPSDEEVAAARAEHVAEGQHDDAHEATTRTRTTRRTRLAIAGVAAGALVVGGLAVGIPALTPPTPQQLVDDYVAAVSAGDAAAAAALWTPHGTDIELAMLAEAEPTQPPTFACEPVVVDEDAATAACTLDLVVEGLTLGGPVSVELEHDGARWALASGVEERGTLFLALGEVASVAGIAVPEGMGVTTAPLLLPGAYDVDVVVSPLVQDPDGERGLVVGIGGGTLRLGLEPAADVREVVEAFAIDHVEACVAAGDTLGDCAVPRFDPAEDLVATPVPDRSGLGYGLTAIQVLDVGVAGTAPEVRVTVTIAFASDGGDYRLTLESVSQEDVEP